MILLFPKGPLKGEKINFTENNNNISNDTKLCNIFNGFFPNIYTDVVRKIINNLNVTKCRQINDTPTKVIKMNKDTFVNFITDHFNYCIAYGEFPDELKHVDIKKAIDTGNQSGALLTDFLKAFDYIDLNF